MGLIGGWVRVRVRGRVERLLGLLAGSLSAPPLGPDAALQWPLVNLTSDALERKRELTR